MEGHEENMIDDRPDSDYRCVAPTNLKIYCFLVNIPVGHNYMVKVPDCVSQRK